MRKLLFIILVSLAIESFGKGPQPNTLPGLLHDSVVLNYEGIMMADTGEEIILPMRISRSAEISALTISLRYNTNLLRFTDLEGNWEGLLFAISHENGTINIAWSNVNPQSVNENDVLIRYRAIVLDALDSTVRYMELLPGAEFADSTATIIDSIGLTLPFIQTSSPPELPVIEAPGSFSPNGDGLNDYFYIRSTGIIALKADIYDRCGRMVYQIEGPEGRWDGHTTSGRKVPEGSYFYYVAATTHDDKRIEQHGTVFLIRDEVKVSPNPVGSILNLQLDLSSDEAYTIEVLNTQGLAVRKESGCYGDGAASLDVTNLPAGIYFLRLIETDGIHITRFIRK